VRGSGGRLAAVIGGSSLAVVGYGAVLPYLYTDIADARGLGGMAAAGMFTAFAVGSLLATPAAGRLADQRDPAVVATWARLVVAAAVALLAFAPSAGLVWLAAALYGAAYAATQPAVQVLLLAWTPEHRRRDVFAWQFIGSNLALAAGGLVGGFVVDLSSAAGVRPIFYVAVAAEVLSAVVVWTAARGARLTPSARTRVPGEVGYRVLLRRPAVRWLLAVTVLLTLACYAQYDSGLPAYTLSALHVSPKALGVAVAINAVLVAVLTGPVVAVTRRRDPASLLAACAGLWVGCWLLLGMPLLHVGSATGLVIAGYAAFSIGETMLSPVLTPLAAELAPPGASGRALAAIGGANTLATAAGPALSGVLLALHAPGGFIALQLACCLGAIGVTGRLRAHATGRPGSAPGDADPAPERGGGLVAGDHDLGRAVP
jgi:MFS family permease